MRLLVGGNDARQATEANEERTTSTEFAASAQRVSLSYLVAELEQATEGAAQVLEAIEAGLYDDEDVPKVGASSRAILSLVSERMRLLYFALIGERDPRLLYCRHTAAPEALAGLPPTADEGAATPSRRGGGDEHTGDRAQTRRPLPTRVDRRATGREPAARARAARRGARARARGGVRGAGERGQKHRPPGALRW